MKKLSVLMMKIGIVCIAVGLMIQAITSLQRVWGASSRVYYARVLSEGVYLCSVPATDSEMFQIPPTYFVELTSDAGENYYAARYLDISGYIRKNEVSPVSGTPQKPFVQGRYATVVAGGDSVFLRTKPSRLATWDYRIPDGETNVMHYGKASGEEVIEGNADWFFVRVYIDNSTTRVGYVYSHFCLYASLIAPNSEILPLLTTPPFQSDDHTEGEKANFGSMSTALQLLIVAGVAIPCIVIVYLFFKPARAETEAFEGVGSQPAKARLRQTPKKQRRDYYEMDD